MFSARSRSPGHPPLLLAHRSRAPASPADRQRGLGRPDSPAPSALPTAGQRPTASAARGPSPSPCRRRRRCRCRCAESARSPPEGSGGTDRSRGSWRAPGAPRLPPGQGRGGAQGATRRVGAAAGPLLPRRSQSPGSTLRPPPRTTTTGLTVPAPRSPPRRRTRVTPTRSRGRSQPLARGETPTWLPPSPLLPLPLLRLLHPPPLSRLPPDCAAASPEGALPALRAAPPVRAPVLRACLARPGPRALLGQNGRGFPARATRARPPLCRARKGSPAPGTAEGGQAERSSYSLLISPATKSDVAASGPHPKQVV